MTMSEVERVDEIAKRVSELFAGATDEVSKLFRDGPEPPKPPIALTGKLRSGKSAAARYLDEEYGYAEFAFGDALKGGFHRRYPEIPREPKPRVGYQMHGQLMRRLIGKDVWIDKCFDDISAYLSNFAGPVIISDLRQPNEFDRCKREGYVIIRINCADDVRRERARAVGDAFTDSDLNHETERHIDGFSVDYEIDGSGGLDELHRQIDEIMATII